MPGRVAWVLVVLIAGCGGPPPAGPDGGPDADAAVPGPGTDEPIIGPAAASQVRAAMAGDAGGALLVWQDDRRDEGGDIFGARLAPDGEILDPVGLPISTAGGTQESPRVAFDGDGYLVVWTDWRYLALSVFAARVTAGGQVLDPDGILIGSGSQPDVAFDGDRFVVVRASGPDVIAARVSTSGEVLDPGGIRICGAGEVRPTPTVVAGPDGSLIAWLDGRNGAAQPELFAGRLSREGASLDGCGVRIAGDAGAARLAFDGTRYWAAWESAGDLRAARIASDLTVLDPGSITVAGGPGSQGGPVIARDGDGVIVAWHDQVDPADGYAFDIHARRLAADGTVLGEPLIVSAEPGQQARPALGTAGDTTWVAWDGDSVEPWDIFARRLGGGASVRISSAGNAQYRPRIAGNGEQMLLVWSDRRDAPATRTFAQHLDATGAPLPEPVRALSAAGDHAVTPAVTDGLVCHATWSGTAHRISATRVGTTGGPLDPDGIAVVAQPELHLSPAVAGDGDGYLVIWEAERPEDEYPVILAARMTGDGRILDPGGMQVSAPGEAVSSPSVAYGGGVYLVAWTRYDVPDYDLGAAIAFAVVDRDGTVLTRGTLGSPDPEGDKVEPRVAFDGTGFLVVWELHLHTGWNIFASRVTPAGEVLDAEGIAISTSVAGDGVLYIDPSVTFDGQHYLIGWQDEYLSRVQVTRLAPDGTLVDAEPITLSAEPLGQRHLSLGVSSGGQVTAAFEVFDPTAGTWRVVRRRP